MRALVSHCAVWCASPYLFVVLQRVKEALYAIIDVLVYGVHIIYSSIRNQKTA